uniref:Kininogen 1 n=1 Tax=Chelydra serpentina TaxID=8475 RepID=A0A8C3S467_CHESE
MKLSTVLVLCCSFFSSRARLLSNQDADCDDPDVFEAVDIALRKYNGDKTDGNQFALYMVMEAKRIFSVVYRIRESSCAVGGDKLWQDCDYRASAKAVSGECTAQVYIDETEKISNVKQDCKIIPVEGKVKLYHALCLGCYHPIPGDSLQLLPILRYAIRIFNNRSEQSSLFEVGEIIKASRQVVAGWNYAVEYEIKETNCTKNNFQDLSPECKPIVGGHVGRCEAKAYVDLSDTIVDVAQKCKFPVEETVTPPISVCAGCPRPIPINSAELEEPLKAALEKYNEESNDDFYYKTEAILYATMQVGILLSFSCSVLFRTTSPYFIEMAHVGFIYFSQVYVIPWTKTVRPTVNCTKETNTLIRRPPGFTPFRSLAVEAGTAQHTPQSKNEKGPREAQAPCKGPGKDIRREPAHEQGHRHDIGYGPEHENRRGHGYGHGDEDRPRHDIGHEPEHKHGDKHGRGHGHGHGKHKDKLKDKQKHSEDSSSEESHDKVTNQKETLVAVAEIPGSTQSCKPDLVELDVLPSTQQPTIDGFTEISDLPGEIPDLPAEPDSPGIIPDIPLSGGLPDLPEPSVPKCPGKPWKPIIDLSTTTNKPKLLTNEDLLPHLLDSLL